MIHFGTFLVEQGMATPENIIHALDLQRAKQKPVGRIALEYRLLEMNQLFNILNRQADTQLRFCDIALALGYLTREQVDFIRSIQTGSRPKTGELLLEMGVLSREQLENALEAYKKMQESTFIDANTAC